MLRIPFLSGGKGESAIDPVCHMEVNVKNPNGGTHEHEGQTYYFCGQAAVWPSPRSRKPTSPERRA